MSGSRPGEGWGKGSGQALQGSGMLRKRPGQDRGRCSDAEEARWLEWSEQMGIERSPKKWAGFGLGFDPNCMEDRGGF